MGDPLPSGNLLVGGLEHVLFLQMGNEIGTHGEKKYIVSQYPLVMTNIAIEHGYL